MPTSGSGGGQLVKCAEIFLDIGTQKLEYQCTTCSSCFACHQSCIHHVRKCATGFVNNTDWSSHHKAEYTDNDYEFRSDSDRSESSIVLPDDNSEDTLDYENQPKSILIELQADMCPLEDVEPLEFSYSLASYSQSPSSQNRQTNQPDEPNLMCTICGNREATRREMLIHMKTHASAVKTTNANQCADNELSSYSDSDYTWEDNGLEDVKPNGTPSEMRSSSVALKKNKCSASIQKREVAPEFTRILLRELNRRSEFTNFIECEICNGRFMRRSKLLAHMNRHILKRQRQPPVIDAMANQSNDSLNCSFRDVAPTFTRIILREIGRRSGVNKFIVCDICGRSYNRRSKLLLHMAQHSNPVLERPKPRQIEPPPAKRKEARIGYLCQLCPEVFSTARLRMLHKERTHKVNVCEFCGAAFASPRNLKSHRRIHTGEKPYKCEFCDRSFSTHNEHKLHTRMHKGERPYACPSCPKTYPLAHLLNTHMRRHTNDRRYPCPSCDKAFFNLTALKNHIRIHTGERPFACGQCDKSFSKGTLLRVHMNVHAGIKPYECRYCERKYYSSTSRLLHEKTLHKDEQKYE